jgi:hypothetical protein
MIVQKIDKILIISILSLFLLASCTQEKKSSSSDSSEPACISSGDLIVSNSGSDVVLVLNADGSYKNIAYNVSNTAETVYGVAWSQAGELLVGVDGADRIVAVNAATCESRTFAADGSLTGTIRGLTQLLSGDILIVETSNIEKFNSLGMRVTSGGWPKALQTGGTDVSAMSTGGFVHCSSTADVVRTYDSLGAQVATVSSGIAATTDAASCIELSNGSIAAAWSGTTDTVKIYSSNLSTTLATFSDTSILSAPGGMAQRANGNLLILDRVLHYIVEIDTDGNFVGIVGDGVLSTPEQILVVP